MRLIEAGEVIPVFGDGSTRRDYTFIADTVDGIIRSLYYTGSNYEVINLGNDQSITLADMVDTIETVVGKKACIDRHSEQPGDVSLTWADIRKARELLGYDPKTKFADGMAAFYNWYQKGLEDGD